MSDLLMNMLLPHAGYHARYDRFWSNGMSVDIIYYIHLYSPMNGIQQRTMHSDATTLTTLKHSATVTVHILRY